jgi:hypothetical protein
MKALVKLVVEFVGWRWAPAVGLLAASALYVLIVVGLVPSEIGVPVANAKFGTHLSDGRMGSSETVANTYATSTSTPETTPASAPATPMRRMGNPEFGRRGFSPVLDRPEPPSPAPPPTPIAPNALSGRGPLGGIFSRIQGALRPGTPAAQALSQAAQSPPATPAPPSTPPAQAPAVQVPPPAVQVPPPAAPSPSPPTPPEAVGPAATDNGAPPGAAPPPADGAPPGQPGQPTSPPEAAPTPAPEPAPAQ